MISPAGLIARWIRLLAIALCLSPLFGGLATASRALHHELYVRLDPATHQIYGHDQIKITENNTDFLILSLADHLKIRALTTNGQTLKFQFRNGRLAIPLSATQREYQLELKYEGEYNDPVSSRPLNTDNPGYGVTGTIQPQGTLLLSGSGWYPRNPKGNANYQLIVDAPQGTLAVTAGNHPNHTTSEGRTLSHWVVDNPPEGLSLVAGPFHRDTQKFGRLTAATYFSKPLARLSPSYLAATGRYLKLYEDLFGPYPFEQFAVVENFFPTGYGFPSFTLMGRRVLQLPFIIHTSLGHEIAHCWWGNGVLVDPSLGNWSEGLTTYVADYLFKEQKGKGTEHRRQWLRNYASLVDDQTDMALSDFYGRSDKVTRTIGYDKAAMVFHMLRQQVGEDQFWQTLRDVFAQYRFQAISWSHWQRAFERASGRPLRQFFQDWVYRPGAPQVTLSNVEVVAEKAGYAVHGIIEQSQPYFDFNLDLALHTDAETHIETLTVSGAQTPFSVRVSKVPLKLIADPKVNLFRRLSPQELPTTINTVKGTTSVKLVIARNLDARWMKIAQRLATALGLDGADIHREEKLSQDQLNRNDLIWIGQPQDGHWLPKSQEDFHLKKQTMMLAGKSFSRQTTSFFGVFEHPHNKDRIVALFLPESYTLAKALSTKIPHYGKYSYLLFKDARNQVKGTWPAKDSPLTVQWDDNKLK